MIEVSRTTRFLAALSALVLVAAGCQKSNDSAGARLDSKDYKAVAEILADTVGGMAVATPAEIAPLPDNVVFSRDDIPNEGGYLQVTLGEVSDAQANSFMRRVKTEKCSCGCVHTIDQCLIQDPQCDTAHQLAAQVLKEVTGGI
jgi:hypothetical protein